MKVKNLLLAGLVAVAMSACSNETENGSSVDNLAKDAKMQLSITLPTATGTRANATEVGELQEQKINNLTVVVVNKSSVVVKYYTKDELVNGTEGFASIKNTTPAFDVTSGTAQVYAYANYPQGEIHANNYNSYEIEGSYTDKLTLSGDIANFSKENFYMSGSNPNVEITAGSVINRAIVPINRVAAKISETTPNKPFTPTATLDQNPTIQLTDYLFYNLSKQTGVLLDFETVTKFYNKYDGAENVDCTPLWIDNQTPSIKITDKTQSTYCLANKNHKPEENTNIAYRAKINYAKGVADEDGTFYVRKAADGIMKVYSLTSLKAAYQGLYDNFDKDTTTKTWFDNGVLKYTKGISYYKKELTTNSVAEIVRNNVYKVTVKSISGLGAPELDMPEVGDLTMLTVEVRVQPWTIQINDIEL